MPDTSNLLIQQVIELGESRIKRRAFQAGVNSVQFLSGTIYITGIQNISKCGFAVGQEVVCCLAIAVQSGSVRIALISGQVGDFSKR